MTGNRTARRERTTRRKRTHQRGRPLRGERGSATIWAAGGIAALLVIAAALLELGAAMVTRHRAGGAADLAALAAAEYATEGEPVACARARWVAEGMRVRLKSCRLSGWDALVEVTAQPAGPLARFPAVTAHARAGPVDDQI